MLTEELANKIKILFAYTSPNAGFSYTEKFVQNNLDACEFSYQWTNSFSGFLQVKNVLTIVFLITRRYVETEKSKHTIY